MKPMRIADDFTLQPTAPTEKQAFLGRTGSGKTFAAMKCGELFLEIGAQIIALDPVGCWFGLRIGGNFQIYIFGGLHADYPLRPESGKLIADLIADRGISAVLDISQFIRSEQIRFASDFIEHFYQRRKAKPAPVHIFLEEAQEFVPQNPQSNEAAMLHHFERAWKIGRNFGIGGSLISQRPQELNKKALNQAGTLFVFQMTGPQERKAIKEWTRQAGIDEEIDAVLPTLKVGQPHVWCPALAISKTVRILPKITADVSATPELGARVKEQPLSPIDVERLNADMAATVERSKADDPKELRKQISELQRKVQQLEARKPEAGKVERVEVSVFTDADRTLLKEVEEAFRFAVDQTRTGAETVKEYGDAVSALLTKIRGAANPPKSAPPAPRVNTPINTSQRQANTDNGSLGKCERAILSVLVQREQGSTKSQTSVLSGYSIKSSSFTKAIGALRARGWIQGNDVLYATSDGLRVLGEIEPLPTGDALLLYWQGKLALAERTILGAIAQAHPHALTTERVSDLSGYSINSSSFTKALSKLRTLELIEGRGELKASDTLFE